MKINHKNYFSSHLRIGNLWPHRCIFPSQSTTHFAFYNVNHLRNISIMKCHSISRIFFRKIDFTEKVTQVFIFSKTLPVDHVSFPLLLATIYFYLLEIFLHIVPNCKQTVKNVNKYTTKYVNKNKPGANFMHQNTAILSTCQYQIAINCIWKLKRV